MSLAIDNNKRIARNTLLLYIRMFFLLLINLYTSRIILNTLGVVDYGLNNVVGGVIGMLGFLTGSLSGATSRFITFDLGKGDQNKLYKVFGSVMFIHYLFAGVILLFGETLGLWFVSTQLQIPPDRFTAAFWVYQFSILSSIMSIISIPYDSDIIAHEKMSAFAYITLLDAVLKLLIVYLLVIIPYDKLIVYSVLFFFIQLLDRCIYYQYCRRHFLESKAKPKYDKLLFKEIFSYAGWTMTGNLSVVGYTQGLNILLNMFFGPAVNAARGIAVQVQNVCQQFCSNFQMAFNPQLTKKYAQGDLDQMHRLLIHCSKFSFYILLFIAIPLMIEAPFVLKIWLGIVPNHTVNFLRLILIIGILYTLSNPVVVSLHATGRIKKFQIIESSMLLCIVPIAYIGLKFFKIRPESVFAIHIIVEMFTQYVRLYLILPNINMKMTTYVKNVIVPILFVVVLAPMLPLLINVLVKGQIVNFFSVCITCVIFDSVIIYFIGCDSHEKSFLRKQAANVYNKIFHK